MKTPSLRRFALLLPLLGQLCVAEVLAPAGAARGLVLADLAPHPINSKTYNEFWTYQLRLNNTIDLEVNISRGNFGSFKEPVCGANVTLNNFKGANYSVAREYPVSNFIWSPSTAKLQVHKKIFFEGNPPEKHRLFFETTKQGVTWKIDLTFEAIESSLITGNGEWKIDGHTVGMAIHIPWAKVSGTLSVNEKTTAVTGTAMMDHVWQDDLASKMVNRAYRWRTHSASSNWEVAYLLVPKSGGTAVAGLSLQKKEGMVRMREVRSLQLLNSSVVGRVKEWPSSILLDDGVSRDTVHFKPYWSRHSVLDEFSGVTRWTIKKFLGGDMVNDRGGAVINRRRGDYAHMFTRD